MSPYPPTTGGTPPVVGSTPPVAGPGSGFPVRSGLAGMQPHSMTTPANLIPGSGAGIRGGVEEDKNVFDALRDNSNVYARKFQAALDRSTPHVTERWLVTGTLLILFSLSVVVRQGWYIVMCAYKALP